MRLCAVALIGACLAAAVEPVDFTVENGIVHTSKLLEALVINPSAPEAHLTFPDKVFYAYKPQSITTTVAYVTAYGKSSPSAFNVYKFKARNAPEIKKQLVNPDHFQCFQDQTHGYIFSVVEVNNNELMRNIGQMTPSELKAFIYNISRGRHSIFEAMVNSAPEMKTEDVQAFEERITLTEIVESHKLFIPNYIALRKDLAETDKTALNNLLAATGAFYKRATADKSQKVNWKELADIINACPIPFPSLPPPAPQVPAANVAQPPAARPVPATA